MSGTDEPIIEIIHTSIGIAKGYGVKKVLDKRISQEGVVEYLLQWVGFGDGDNSWVPAQHLFCPVELAEFENSRSGKVDTVNAVVEENVEEEDGEADRKAELETIKINDDDTHGSSPRGSATTGERSLMESSDDLTKVMGSRKRKTYGYKPKQELKIVALTVPLPSIHQPWPMLTESHNHIVLQSLFRICPPSLQAMFRLVNNTWYKCTREIWRSSTTIPLRYRKTTDSFVVDDGVEDVGEEEADKKTTLVDFLKLFASNYKEYPYRQFHLKKWVFDSSKSGRSAAIQDRFFAMVGAYVTSLKLTDCVFNDDIAFRKVVLRSCPNLENLTLDGSTSLLPLKDTKGFTNVLNKTRLKVLSIGLEDQLPITKLEMLSSFPSLTCLRLISRTDVVSVNNENFLFWLKTVKHLRTKRTGLHLVSLKFELKPAVHLRSKTNLDASVELCELIGELKLIFTLVIDLNCNLKLLTHFLTMTRATVRNIKAVQDGARKAYIPLSNFPCSFPFGVTLEAVAELIISGRFCHDLAFIQFTLNLRKLHIYYNSEDKGLRTVAQSTKLISNTPLLSMSVPLGERRLLHMKELWLGYAVEDDDVFRLCDWFPNMEVMTMALTNFQFSIVCNNWLRLKHVHMLGNLLSDEGLTGILTTWDRFDNLLDIEIRPSLSHLKELRCFHLLGDGKSRISDSSVTNGFLKVPNLQLVEIPKGRIGIEALTLLKEKVPFSNVRGAGLMDGASSRQSNFDSCKYIVDDNY